MSMRTSNRAPRGGRRRGATLFAALGDQTRLRLLERLGTREMQSITQLSSGIPVSRQAVSKHLGVLERARLVSQQRHGRERMYCIVPGAIVEAQAVLQAISQQWDEALARLKSHVEGPQNP